MTYFTIAAIRQANKDAGRHFFSPASMRFFRSRVAPGVYGGRYFVTSEQFDANSPRLYMVHYITNDGQIEDATAFQEFATLAQARTAAKKIAASDLDDAMARKLASDWHSGGGSALYKLASTGAINADDNQFYTAWEIRRTIKTQLTTPGYIEELNALLRYVLINGTRGPVPGWNDLPWPGEEGSAMAAGE